VDGAGELEDYRAFAIENAACMMQRSLSKIDQSALGIDTEGAF